MKKTICELFAGVGGFRLGFERLNSGWETVWFSQWEPGAKTQWAHDCYVSHFGECQDIRGEIHTGEDISKVDKTAIPNHTLLVGGFPCQDYSVAHSLSSSRGIEGKKGVLWWQIRDTLIAKNPPFCIFENVDRLLKSPAKQRGRDFGVILACFEELGYSVEWRVVNAALYGASQRRRRTFIFAYKNDTKYGNRIKRVRPSDVIEKEGLMVKAFPIQNFEKCRCIDLPKDIFKVSDEFAFDFQNAGYMHDGIVYTTKIIEAEETAIAIKRILEENVDEKFYITEDKMTKWVYLKGAKKIPRKSANGHEYVFSEGPIAFPDSWEKPGRTMLTSESTLNRSTHVVTDPGTGRLRLLTPIEAERLQGFDDDWTNTGMPDRMRFFCMGNALVVPMITRMAQVLDDIIDNESGTINRENNQLHNVTEHIYSKEDLINRFDKILNKTLGEIDELGIFNKAQAFDLQKGIAGTIIEQCVLRYPPDCEQKPDLIVVDGDNRIATELKTTGLRISDTGGRHFVAKEPMSITAVGVYDIAHQNFYDSHFWSKIEHMLIVYYHYLEDNAVPPAKYAPFPIKGYEFHEFSEEEIATLRKDWYIVHDFCAGIVSSHPGPHSREWKMEVKEEYIARHSALRRFLSYIELVPKFPPRFRLKKPIVNAIVAKHFGYELEQLPGRYVTITDIDAKCKELRRLYGGLTIGELADRFGVPRLTTEGKENKGITEQVVVKMFGGESKKLNNIEVFQRFGLVAKSIAITPTGSRTEDMKLYHIDFDEMTKTEYTEEDGTVREFEFEDSELYEYFAGNEFLCILFEEPQKEYYRDSKTNKRIEVKHSLAMNTFLGFHRLVFSEEFIETSVRACWEDTRTKIFEHTLEDVICRYKDGTPRYNNNGEVSSAPNFMKASHNTVFIRGGGEDSSYVHKTESVNGIRMLPQFIWLKGKAIVEELGLRAE